MVEPSWSNPPVKPHGRTFLVKHFWPNPPVKTYWSNSPMKPPGRTLLVKLSWSNPAGRIFLVKSARSQFALLTRQTRCHHPSVQPRRRALGGAVVTHAHLGRSTAKARPRRLCPNSSEKPNMSLQKNLREASQKHRRRVEDIVVMLKTS